GFSGWLQKACDVMDCAGRAQRRRRFRTGGALKLQRLSLRVGKRCRASLATALQDAVGFSGWLQKACDVMDCAGRAQRRRRFRTGEERSDFNGFPCMAKSGVALRLPPHSKMLGAVDWFRHQSWKIGTSLVKK